MGYVYLGLAIFGELIGTTCLKYSAGFTKLLPTAGVFIAYGLCFWFLAKSLQSINLSVAYAVWSAIGIVAATLLSVFLFGEHLNGVGILAMFLIVTGVVLLNLFGSIH